MKLINTQSVSVAQTKIENENNNEFVISEKNNKEIIIEENIMPKIYDIPLEKSLQILLCKECEKYNLSYELCLAIINVETKFDPKEISKDGHDKGLFQLRDNTYPQILKELNLENQNIMNPVINIKCGVWQLNYLQDYWISQGFDDEQVFNLMLNSYHFGITKVKNKPNKFIKNTKYINAVYDYKYKLESEKY